MAVTRPADLYCCVLGQLDSGFSARHTRSTGVDMEPDRVAHPVPVLGEGPVSFDDQAPVGAGVDEAPEHVRECADSDLRWQRTLSLESAPDVEQPGVALLLARAQGLLDLW